jgi:hypothetical protein
MKRLDVLLQCQTRYEKIVYDTKRKIIDEKRDAQDYYDLFWDLQVEQYQYWKLGYLDSDTYSYWMHWRYVEWQRNDSINGVDYHEGWKRFCSKTRMEGKDFHLDMESVFSGEHRLLRKYLKLHKR